MSELPILYRDEHYVAIHKPAGLLVHRSALSRDPDCALQRLRDQLGCRVYPVHRLDRPTSGVLLFALSSEAARRLGAGFETRRVDKTYLAVVRGHVQERGRIDYALREAPGREPQPAVTDYRRLATVELPIPVGRYPQARYSLLEVYPHTGRMHQIRKHLAHIFHPIVGDTTHGEGRHNRLFREHFSSNRLLLVATRLSFPHPYQDRAITVRAAPEPELCELFRRLGWELPDDELTE